MASLLIASTGLGAETMRIAVGPEAATAIIEGPGLTAGEDSDDAAFAALGRERVVVSLSADRLSVDRAPTAADSVRFRPSGPMSVNGVKVRGDVVVVKGRTQLLVVNVIPLEDYLVGVLGGEMPAAFPLEALKAQAVAARTYALNKKLEQYGQPFHLGSTVLSQVYKGLGAEVSRTRQAVEATRGEVMTWMLQPIEAYFHASCGGRTEAGAEALGRELPYLQPVDCPCGQLPTSHWTLQLGAKELGLLGAPRGPLEVQGRTRTGRAVKVVVGARTMDAVTFREKLGYGQLKSLAFEVERARDGWAIQGRGFGHGAGLCQWGARMYAEKGWDYRKILRHYYPGIEFQVLYE